MPELSDARTRLIGRLRRRRTRERERLVLVEGPRAVRDGLEAGLRPRFAVVSPRLAQLDPELMGDLAACTEVVEVGDDTLARLADTEAPQGVLAVVDEPPGAWFEGVGPEARLLVLDALQDPGNVGTLIRSAAAFGVDGVVLLDGTVDPFNPKAVRASAGAVFRCPVVSVPWSRAEGHLAEASVPLIVADAGGDDATPLPPPAGWALVVGSEGQGVREAVRARAVRSLRVPMSSGVESLNAAVAGALLLYELTRLNGGKSA